MALNPRWEHDDVIGYPFLPIGHGAVRLRVVLRPGNRGELSSQISDVDLPKTHKTVLEAQLYAEETAREWLKDALKELENNES